MQGGIFSCILGQRYIFFFLCRPFLLVCFACVLCLIVLWCWSTLGRKAQTDCTACTKSSDDLIQLFCKKAKQNTKLLCLKKKKKLLWSLLTIDSAVSVNSLHPCGSEVRQRKLHSSFLPHALLCLCLQRNSNLLQIAWAVCSCTTGEQHYFSSLPKSRLAFTNLLFVVFFFSPFLCTLLRKSSKYHGLLSFGITTSALKYCPCCNDHLKLDWAYQSPLCEGQSNILPWSVTECVSFFFSNGFPSRVSLVLGFYQTVQMQLILTLPSLRLTCSQTDLIFWLEPGYEKVKNLRERKRRITFSELIELWPRNVSNKRAKSSLLLLLDSDFILAL